MSDTITIEVAATVAAYIKKADRTFTVDMTTIKYAGVAYLLEYGLKQSLGDSVADSKGYAEKHDVTETEAMAALTGKRFDAIMAGTVGSGGQSGDPLRREIRAQLAAKIPGWAKLERHEKAAKIENVANGVGRDGNPNKAAEAILAEAKRRVAEAAAVTESLGDL